MKKIIAILLISAIAVFAGTSTEIGVPKKITFSHSVGMDSVRIYAGQDTTSWEIDRWMVRVYSGDSTQYALIDTFDTAGSYWIKFAYYEGGAAVKYLADEMLAISPADYKATGFSTFDPTTDIVTPSDTTESGDSLAVLADSLSYQGSASGLTAAGVASTTADTLAGRGYLSGGGAYACTLLVLATADSTAVPNPAIYLRSTGASAIYAKTDNAGSDGKEIFSLDAGGFDVYLLLVGYSYTVPQTITISGNATDTVWATALTATAAPSGMVAIQTWLLTAAGDTINPSYVRWRFIQDSSSVGGWNAYSIIDRLTSKSGSNTILHGKGWHTVTKTTSYFNFNLVPNASIYVNGTQDTSSYYEFEGEYAGNKTTVRKQVPTSGPYNPFAP